MKLIKDISTFEWDAAGFKVVRVRRRRGAWVPAQLLDGRWPDRLNVPNPECEPALYRDTLASFFKKYDVIKGDIFLVLPRAEFFIRWKNDVRPLPVPSDELIWRDRLPAMSYGIPAKRFEAFSSLFAALGFRLKGAAPNFMAHARIYGLLTSDDGVTALVDIASPQRQITIVQGGTPLYCRSMNSAHLLEDLSASIDFYNAAERGGAIAKIVFLGGSRLPQAAAAEIASRFRMRVDTTLFPDWRGWAGAYGQAMAIGKNEAWLLEPPAKKLRVPVRFSPASAAAVSLLLLSGGFYLKSGNRDLAARIAHLDRRLYRPETRRSDADILSVVADMADRFPSGARLTHLQYDSTHRTLQLRGRTGEYGAISRLTIELAAVPTLSDVRSDQAASLTIGDRTVVDFSVSGGVR